MCCSWNVWVCPKWIGFDILAICGHESWGKWSSTPRSFGGSLGQRDCFPKMHFFYAGLTSPSVQSSEIIQIISIWIDKVHSHYPSLSQSGTWNYMKFHPCRACLSMASLSLIASFNWLSNCAHSAWIQWKKHLQTAQEKCLLKDWWDVQWDKNKSWDWTIESAKAGALSTETAKVHPIFRFRASTASTLFSTYRDAAKIPNMLRIWWAWWILKNIILWESSWTGWSDASEYFSMFISKKRHLRSLPQLQLGIFRGLLRHLHLFDQRGHLAAQIQGFLVPKSWQKNEVKHLRCNLDVCPELMSRNQRIVQRGWLILIPHEDKVDVVSPFSILVIGGGGFCSFMKIMLM